MLSTASERDFSRNRGEEDGTEHCGDVCQWGGGPFFKVFLMERRRGKGGGERGKGDGGEIP